MAKILFGAIAGDARGKIAGNVFSKSRFGAYIRKKTSGVQPRSVAQQSIRQTLTGFSKRWASILTDVQRAAWKSLAEGNPVTNVFGNQVTLTGLQMYIACNQNLVSADQAPIDDPAINLAVTSPGVLVAAQAMSGAFTLTPGNDIGADDHCQIYAAAPINPGRSFVGNKYTLLVKDAPSVAGVFTLTVAEYQARFGTLSAGQKIPLAVQYVSAVTGAKSGRSTATLIRT